MSARSSLPVVGVAGLGAMGSRMALRLISSGFQVFGFNRTRAKAERLCAHGLLLVDEPAQLAKSCDVVLSMVWDSAALENIMLSAGGVTEGLRPGALCVDMSTVSPSVSRFVASKVAACGGTMLDAPVSGSIDAAAEGRLAVFVGGDERALGRVRPVLDALASSVHHLGPNGRGLIVKLAVNLQVALQAVAWAEALALLEGDGITTMDATSAMLGSVIASPMLRYRAPFVVDPPCEIWASASQLRKDVMYALEAAEELGLELTSGGVVLQLLDVVNKDGNGDREAAALIDLVRARAGDRHRAESGMS